MPGYRARQNTELPETLTAQPSNAYPNVTRMKGMHIKLPTKENLNNMYHPDADGKFVRSYLLFNPLSESAYEDGYSLELMVDLLKISLATSIAALGDLLFIAYSQPKLQHDIPLELQEFIGNAKYARHTW